MQCVMLSIHPSCLQKKLTKLIIFSIFFIYQTMIGPIVRMVNSVSSLYLSNDNPHGSESANSTQALHLRRMVNTNMKTGNRIMEKSRDTRLVDRNEGFPLQRRQCNSKIWLKGFINNIDLAILSILLNPMLGGLLHILSVQIHWQLKIYQNHPFPSQEMLPLESFEKLTGQ